MAYTTVSNNLLKLSHFRILSDFLVQLFQAIDSITECKICRQTFTLSSSPSTTKIEDLCNVGSKSVCNLVQFKLFLRTGASLTTVKISLSVLCALEIRLQHRALT